MVFRRSVIIQFLLFISFFSHSLNVSSNGQLTIVFKKEAPAKLYLYSFFGIKTTKIDSLNSNSHKVFNFILDKNLKSGYYRISVNDTNYVDLILTGKEKVELIAYENNLKKRTEIKKSAENKALWELKEFRISYNKNKNDILVKLEKYKNDPKEIKKIKKSKDSLERFSNNYTWNLLNKNKDTYFYLFNKPILSPLYTDSATLLNEYKNDTIAFLKENFFDNIDFSKEELVNSTLLPNQYMKYFERYVDYDENGFKHAVDLILSKSKANGLVYQLSLDFLFQLFDEAGPALMFEYLVENYYNKDICNTEYAGKISRLKSLGLGNVIPDLPLEDFQPYKNLKEIYSKNKLTLIFFWSSHCNFCTDATAKLLEIYPEYHPIGFEVLGISIDEVPQDWKDYIDKNHINWLNYNEFKGWESKVVKEWMINKTPTFFLVNTKGVIIGKSSNFVEMRDVVQGYFDKK